MYYKYASCAVNSNGDIMLQGSNFIEVGYEEGQRAQWKPLSQSAQAQRYAQSHGSVSPESYTLTSCVYEGITYDWSNEYLMNPVLEVYPG